MSIVNRQFALIMAVICAIGTACVMAGCGGSGGGASETGLSFTLTPVNATIDLPSGTPISNLTVLTAGTSISSRRANAQGKVAIDIYDNGPQYSDVRDDQDRLVLASFLSSEDPVLDASSTAQALILVALSGLVQPGDAAAQMLEKIPDLTGFSGVVNEVQTQLTTNGYVSLEVGNLASLIQAIVNSMAPSIGRGIVAEPTFNSGIFLDTLVDGQISIQNNYLRRVSAKIRRVSYTIENGTGGTQEFQVNEGYQDVPIATPGKYSGLVATINSAFTGNIAWTPTVNGPFKTPLNPNNAKTTTYELLTFGPGVSEGDFDKLTPEMQDEYDLNLLKTWFLDLILPAAINIALPLKSDKIGQLAEFAGRDVLVIDTLNILRGTAPDLIALLRQGNFSGALSLAYTTGVTSNTAVPLCAHILLEYGPDFLYENSGDLSEGISKILKFMGYAEIFASSTELAILSTDIARSNKADAFYITVTRGTVKLVPDIFLKCAVDPIELVLNDPNRNEFAVYKYEWTVNQGFEVEFEDESTQTSENGTLITFDPNVTVRSVEGEVGEAIVNCKVTRVDTTPDQLVDTDQIKLEFVPRPVLTQSTDQVAFGQTVNLNASYDGPYSVQWKYINETPELGSINRTAQGTSPDCIFTASNTPGTAIIKVEMHIIKEGNDYLACTATKTISVGNGLPTHPNTQWFVHSSNGTTYDGYAAAYVLISKTLHPTGLIKLYRNGEFLKSFLASEGPQETETFAIFRVRYSLDEFNYAVELESRQQGGFSNMNQANFYASSQGAALQQIWLISPNIYWYTVEPEP